jgi:hypothetical protein
VSLDDVLTLGDMLNTSGNVRALRTGMGLSPGGVSGVEGAGEPFPMVPRGSGDADGLCTLPVDLGDVPDGSRTLRESIPSSSGGVSGTGEWGAARRPRRRDRVAGVGVVVWVVSDAGGV